MSIEIRACRDDAEMQAYYAISSYVFAEPDGVAPEEAVTAPEWTTCAWVDGELASTLGTLPFTVRLNGARVKMGGVTQVGTLPGYRRRGLLRQTMTRALAGMREREQPFAILWASMGAIYQRFGYGLASFHVSYHFDPRMAALRDPTPAPGHVRLFSPEEAYAILRSLYIEHATPRNLHIHRSRALWQASTLRGEKSKGPVHAAVYHDAAGQPRGYIVYQAITEPTDAPGPDQVMRVRDFVALDMEAYRGLWQYIRGHDLVRRVDMNGVAPDDPAPDLLLEPRALAARLGDAIWMRVVDVERGLAARPYGEAGEIVIDLAGDAVCPWNEGRWLVATDGATTDVQRTSREADLVLAPNALASLVAGCRSATHLGRAGLVEARDAATLRRADALFRTEYAPHCPNDF